MDAGDTPLADRSRLALVGEVLQRFGQVTIRVTGSSMLPALRPGDELTIRRRSISEARTGEIAVFVRDDRLFAHRIVAQEPRCLVTRGDAVPSPDAPVSEAELLGVAVSVSRDGTAAELPTEPDATTRVVASIIRCSSHASATLQRLRGWLVRLRVGR